jgi:hypothetical protein
MNRKAVRAATAFTGVTACVTGFATAADAQSARQPAHEATAHIRSGNCAGVGMWFHVGIESMQKQLTSRCYGYSGTAHPGTVAAFCAGNNYGYFSGTSWYGGTFNHQTFHASSGYYSFIRAGRFNYLPFTMRNLHISGFAGTTQCPPYTTVA